MLTVKHVSKSYGTQPALLDVSFALGSGFHALLGPNGAGKSTLFQLLTGLFTPEQGSIEVMGLSVKDQLPQALARIGVVFQQIALDLDLTVHTNLKFYGLLRGLSSAQIQQRSLEALERLGLAGMAHKTCRALSGGNRRKVELARALMTMPQVLLMDEATVGLDPASRESLLNEVQQLATTQSLCVLWATHLIDEAERAQQVLILHQGRLLAHDTPAALVSAQDQDLLAAFLRLSGQKIIPKPSRQV